MLVVQTAAEPPNQGRMYLLMMSWTWKRRKALRDMVRAKIQTVRWDAAWIGGAGVCRCFAVFGSTCVFLAPGSRSGWTDCLKETPGSAEVARIPSVQRWCSLAQVGGVAKFMRHRCAAERAGRSEVLRGVPSVHRG